MKDFIRFVREQGVVGLTVGFILGGAVSKVVASLVSDIINPILSAFLGAVGGLETLTLGVGPIKILLGNFLATLIDFAVIALVIYYIFKGLGLEKLDKKKG